MPIDQRRGDRFLDVCVVALAAFFEDCFDVFFVVALAAFLDDFLRAFFLGASGFRVG